MKVFENHFFSIKKAACINNISFWDLLKKYPTLPGSNVEIIELLANVYSENVNLLIEPNDHYLLKDLQQLGFNIKGYLCVSDNVQNSLDDNFENIALWNCSFRGQIISLENSKEVNLKTVKRIFLQATELTYGNGVEVANMISLLRFREKLLSGISAVEYKIEKKQNEFEKREVNKTDFEARCNDSFSSIIKNRKSAQSFSDKFVSENKFKQIINDISTQPNGHFPVATAGNLENVEAWAYVQNVDGIKKGLYSLTPNFSFKSSELTFDILQMATLNQDLYKNGAIWIFLICDFESIMERYGMRSYRFSMLHAGSMLHHLQLSVTSLNLQSRAIGGFDENILNAYLKLTSNKMISAIMVIGE